MRELRQGDPIESRFQGCLEMSTTPAIIILRFSCHPNFITLYNQNSTRKLVQRVTAELKRAAKFLGGHESASTTLICYFITKHHLRSHNQTKPLLVQRMFHFSSSTVRIVRSLSHLPSPALTNTKFQGLTAISKERMIIFNPLVISKCLHVL